MSPVACSVILTLYFCIFTFAICDRDQFLQLVSEWCPYTKFCHADARKIKPNSTNEPCCKPCFCDDDCWKLDNCCPDKELINGPRPPIVPCVDSYGSRSTESSPCDGFYRVIDSCSSSEGISYPEMKCSRINRTSVEDFIWVSDQTGRIYQNKHCAKCNGINDTIPWQIQTTCFDIMKANFVNFKEALLSAKCNIINTVPEDLEHIPAKYKCCNPSIFTYTSCNVTGLMTQHNPAVETACEQSSWPFKLNVQRQFAKNIFCAMCNQDMQLPAASYIGLCNFDVSKWEKDTPITFLIDYKNIAIHTAEKESKCDMDEIFDEILELCRNVLCPIGTAPLNGGCKQLVSKINGLFVSVLYYLDVIWNPDGLFTDYAAYISSEFTALLDLNPDCNVCRKRIAVTEGNKSVSDLILNVTVEFSVKCDYGLALAQLANIRDKMIEVHINDKAALTLLVRSDKQPRANNKPVIQTIFIDTSCHIKTGYALPFEDMICPRFELNYTELELFSNTQRREKAIFASFFKNSETQENVSKVSVCLETYFSAMALNRAQPSNGKMSQLIMLAEVIVLSVSKISCVS